MALLPPDPVYVIRNVDNLPVYSVAFNFLPGGLERLLAGSKNGYIYVYNLQTNRLEQKIHIGESPILHICHTDSHLIAQEKGVKIKVIELTDKGYTDHAIIETDYAGFCRFDANTKLKHLYVPAADSKVNIHAFSGEKVGCLEAPSTDVGDPMCLKHLNVYDRSILLVGYENGWLHLWDLDTSQCVSKLEMQQCPTSIDYLIELQQGICGTVSDVVQIFSIERKDLKLWIKAEIKIKNPGVNIVQTRSDGKVFSIGGWDGHIRIVSWFSLRSLVVLTEHKAAIQDIAYSPQKVSYWKANIMAVGGLDGAITLWNLYNQKN